MAKTIAKKAAPATSKKGGAKNATDAVEVNPELLVAGQAALKGVQFGAEIEASSSDVEDLGLMSVGHAPLNVEGYSIQAIFNGRKRIFSDKFATSKAKKTLSFDGEEFMYRDVIVLTDAEGKSFSIFLTGMLSNLTRVLPYEAPVKITYKGKRLIIEGAYADGESEEHVISLVTDKASQAVVEANQFTKGCTNWLNNPTAPRAKDTTPKEMANLNNYEAAIRSGKLKVSENEKQKILGASYISQAQIAQ